MKVLVLSDKPQINSFMEWVLQDQHLTISLISLLDFDFSEVKNLSSQFIAVVLDADAVKAKEFCEHILDEMPQLPLVVLASHYHPELASKLLKHTHCEYCIVSFTDKDKDKNIDKNKETLDLSEVVGAVLKRSILTHHELKGLKNTNEQLATRLEELERDQQAGRQVQLKLLPQNPKIIQGFEFSHVIYPSKFLSGDFLDYFPINQDFSFFYFSDVSGHGASSAFITAMLKTLAHRWVESIKSKDLSTVGPADFIYHLNTELLSMKLGKHLTLFVGFIDHKAQKLIYSLAAQFPKPIVWNNGQSHIISENTLPVGIFEEVEYPEWTLEIAQDFVLYLFSDGLLECLEHAELDQKEEAIYRYLAKSQPRLAQISTFFNISQKSTLVDDVGMLRITCRGNTETSSATQR